ncbi:MAG: 50S ribosomal protein L24e [Candidatus Njordarchaeia archaeon]|nr:50S ribosomal protein L24e [Candidatus Korarchaeota archaeon]
MIKIPKCSLCEREIPPGTGLMYVFTSGRILWFCSNKCKKNFLVLKRKPSKLKWIKMKK